MAGFVQSLASAVWDGRSGRCTQNRRILRLSSPLGDRARVAGCGEFARYHLTAAPCASFLTLGRDSRIFQDRTVSDILDTAFQAYQGALMAGRDREVPFLPTLPDVPIVTVGPGETVPCCGLYAPLVDDGCRNYQLEGAPVPKAVNGAAIIGAAVLRLILHALSRRVDTGGRIAVFRQDEYPKAAFVSIGTHPVISL